MSRLAPFAVAVASTAVLGCGSGEQHIERYAIETRIANQDVTTAGPDVSVSTEAGDVVQLDIVGLTSDGDKVPAPADARIEWSGIPSVTAQSDTGSGMMSQMESNGGTADCFRVQNPVRFGDGDRDALVAFLRATAGTTEELRATVSGVEHAGTFDIHMTTSAAPSGDADRGKDLFISCASCHGTSGEGGDGPGLNAKEGNLVSDPAWDFALFAIAARVGMDNEGVPLAPDMPLWLTRTAGDGKLLTTQDFADMYAFLKTQTQ